MRVKVDYPQILKMTVSSCLEIKDDTTVEEVKKLVFAEFWKIFKDHFPKAWIHGAAQNITLKDGDEVLDSDKMLKGKANIQAIFIKHV